MTANSKNSTQERAPDLVRKKVYITINDLIIHETIKTDSSGQTLEAVIKDAAACMVKTINEYDRRLI